MTFKTINDDFIKENNARILSSFKYQPRYVPEKNSQSKQASQKPVNNRLKDLLWATKHNLFNKNMTLTKIYEFLGLSGSTGTRIVRECVDRGFLTILQVKFGKGSPKYPILLPEGYKALGLEEEKHYGKGAGYEHVLYQHFIADHFSEYKPVIELNRDGKFIDVAIPIADALIAIEVAITQVHERENIERDFAKAKAGFVLVACKDKKVLKHVQKIVSDMPQKITQRTCVWLISDLLNTHPKEFINRNFPLD
jgi:hypothetical protein